LGSILHVETLYDFFTVVIYNTEQGSFDNLDPVLSSRQWSLNWCCQIICVFAVCNLFLEVL